MRHRPGIVIGLLIGILGGIGTPAAAQSGTVAVGYSALRLMSEGDHVNISKGWSASVGVDTGGLTAVVFDVGGHYRSFEDDDSFKLHTFQAGVQVRGRGARVAPFAQVTAGIAAAEGDSVAVIQPGGGIDLLFRDYGPGLRLAVDLPFYFDSEDSLRGLRFTVGVVMPFGRD